MATILLGLGSNVGDRLANLQLACDLLMRAIPMLQTASVYATAPMYVEDQAVFYNSALIGSTDLDPRSLLKVLKSVEQEVGRRVGRRYGPREIDIDLIAYGNLRYRFGDQLEVPHHLVAERRFVLQPLADVAHDFDLPGLGKISVLLERTNGQRDSVNKVENAVLSIHRH